MTELQWRILIGLVVAAILAIRLLYDYVYPQIIRGEREYRRRLLLVAVSLPVTGPIFLQLFGIELLPMNLPAGSEDFVRGVGAALLLLSGAALMWPRMLKSRRAVWSPPITSPGTIPEHTLVTDGPYRYVRHPFYAACLLGVVAVELALASYLVFVLFAIAVVGLSVVAKSEEGNLEKSYGDQYRQYMQRTWRFVPFVY